MNKLKTFESFMGKNFISYSQLEKIVQEVEDMLVELRDEEFNTKIESRYTYKGSWIQIFISRKNNEFGYVDIEDVVERIKSYLTEEGLFYSGRNGEERSTGRPIISTSRSYNPMNFEVEGIRTDCSMTFKSK